MSDDGTTSTKAFTPEERGQIRTVVSASLFWARSRRTIGIWLKWIFLVIAGIVSIKALLADYLKSLFGGG